MIQLLYPTLLKKLFICCRFLFSLNENDEMSFYDNGKIPSTNST